MSALDERLLDEYRRALGEMINGNPDVYKLMFSEREYREGELTAFDQISKYE